LLAFAKGVWIDGFHGQWFTQHDLSSYLSLGLQACVVSPELHGRPHLSFWSALRSWGFHTDAIIHLCTDFPDDAKRYFYE